MNVNINGDLSISLGLARSFSPEDTGNAKFNALRGFMTNRGFKINYSLADAYYIYFLEEGTSKSKRHIGYIGNRTVPAIAHFLNVKYVHRNKPQLKRIQGISMNGKIDRADSERTTKREKRNLKSLNFDPTTIPEKDEWKHNPSIENTSDDWKRVDYL